MPSSRFRPSALYLAAVWSRSPAFCRSFRTRLKELMSGYIELAREVGNIDHFIVPPALSDRAGVLGALHLAMAAHPGLAK